VHFFATLTAVENADRYVDVWDLFVAEADSIEAGVPVPACPGWDLQDLVAHQVHQLSSACDGTFPLTDALDAIAAPDPVRRDAARSRQDEWCARGVGARRGEPIAQLTAEWDDLVRDAPTEALAGLFPDLAVHFFDLLGSVGRVGHRDAAFVVPALRFWAGYSQIRIEQAGRGPIRLNLAGVPGREDSIGRVDALVVITGTPFELLRAVVGRRSLPQADGLRWAGADEVTRGCFPAYGWRVHDLDE
jgi:hypothetical protein